MNQYESLSLAELKSLVGKNLRDNVYEHDTIPEADHPTNDLSRAIIAAVKREKGAAYLGKISLYNKDRGNPNAALHEWDGGMVYNFGACFVLPVFDDEVVRLIMVRDRATYEGRAKDSKLLDPIFDRIAALGGELLLWS